MRLASFVSVERDGKAVNLLLNAFEKMEKIGARLDIDFFCGAAEEKLSCAVVTVFDQTSDWNLQFLADVVKRFLVNLSSHVGCYVLRFEVDEGFANYRRQ